MLLIIVITLEIIIFLLYLPHAFLYWPIFAAFIYGMFWYMLDDTEDTGNRSWTQIRNWSLWETGMTAVTYNWGDREAVNGERLLFVVLGNKTNMALISGFGLHGGVFAHLDLRYILPWPIFRIPILREVLMWTGAISSGKNVNSIILNMLDKGKSVCYAIDGMRSILHEKAQGDLELGEDLFEFAKQKKINLIPVLIEGEEKRYSINRYSTHAYFLDIIGYPFPLLFGPRIFGEDPPPKVEVTIGVPVDPSKFDDYKNFNSLFFNQITGVV